MSIEGVIVWRYEAPPGAIHWVTRDPASIKRPGEPFLAFPDEIGAAMLAVVTFAVVGNFNAMSRAVARYMKACGDHRRAAGHTDQVEEDQPW